eukprot:15366606-Ditylum_brightwellii.AAC.1
MYPPSSLSVSPAISPTSVVTLSKGDKLEEEEDDDDAIEHATTRQMVLHDTVMHMHTPPSPFPSISESDKDQINKIRK